MLDALTKKIRCKGKTDECKLETFKRSLTEYTESELHTLWIIECSSQRRGRATIAPAFLETRKPKEVAERSRNDDG